MISTSNGWSILRMHVLTKHQINMVMLMRKDLDSAERTFHHFMNEFNDTWRKMAPAIPDTEDVDSLEFANDGAGGFVIITKSHLKR